MSNVTVTRAGSNPADPLDNFPGSGLQDYTDATREYHPPAEPRPDWRQTVAIGVVVAGVLLICWLAFSIWKLFYCWDYANYERCAVINGAEPLLVLLALVLVLGVTLAPWLAAAIGDYRLKVARSVRIMSTFNRFGDPERLDLLPTPGEQARRYAMATALKAQTAQYEQLHSVNTLSPSLTNQAGAMPAGALAAPAESGVTPLLPDSWLEWLTDTDAAPQLLIIGKTRSGKSTLADIALARRAARGDQIAILDIHWATQDAHGQAKWGAIPPVAKTVDEAIAALLDLKAEYEDRKRRMQLPADDSGFVREGGFSPLTILIDEAPELSAEIDSVRRGLWDTTIKFFGSGGAKLNMYVLLLSQSPNTDDVGLNARMRENFTTFALANCAKPYIQRYEADRDRRPELYAALDQAAQPGMKPAELPIVAERSGQVQVLSRSGILSYRVAHINAQSWFRPSVRGSGENGYLGASTDGRTADEAMKETLVVGMKRQGKNREDIRAELQQMGLGLSNDEYAEFLSRHRLNGR